MNITADSKLTRNQKLTIAGVEYKEHGETYRIVPEVRFDDECGNGHNTFSMTADIRRRTSTGRWVEDSCGCLHEDITKRFPQLAKYIKWHLCSTDGPMHYIANTVYFAGDRDSSGLTAGQPNPHSMRTSIQFGNNPIKHKFSSYKHGFMQFLKDHSAAINANGPKFDFEIIGYDHDDRKTYGTKYTFGGYATKWHECPFDTESEALDFLKALQTCDPKFVETVTSWGHGKARELDSARNAAVWPEATDAELSVSKEELTQVLTGRLPALLEAFKADMTELGFTW